MSAERFTVDTNILVYSIDRDAGLRHRISRAIVEGAVRRNCWLTLQSVSEFYAAVTRKRRMPPHDAASQANDWLDLFPTLQSTPGAARVALAEAAAGRSSYWDALLLATAAEGGCHTILTEDMADGSVLGGVRIVNPFGSDDRLSPPAALLLA